MRGWVVDVETLDVERQNVGNGGHADPLLKLRGTADPGPLATTCLVGETTVDKLAGPF